MNKFLLFSALCAWAFGFARGQVTTSAEMEEMGVTALRAQEPALTGKGVIVTQVESAPSPLQFEVNPGSPGQPVSLFTWRSTVGTSVRYPNIVGSESGHAGSVAENLYGEYTGVAPGLKHVVNYETRYFYSLVMVPAVATSAQVFNQSFDFGNHDAAQDQVYDNYIAQYHTVVATGVGDGGPILTPADCYNGLGVAAYGGGSSTGPTADGRCKPDITAPATETSFSTPLVSGAAAILIQAGRTLGVNSKAAVDSCTVKALLLTGAVKPAGWKQTTTAPLDPNYGAGILNVFNSYQELTGGRQKPAAVGFSASGHPPLMSGSATKTTRGWDYRGIASLPRQEGVNHYLLTTNQAGALITTLVWNKGFRAKGINQLALYVYGAGGNLLGSSESTVDNVQQVYVTGLATGTYEIEVVKAAGAVGKPGVETEGEVYALGWDFGR
jgi:hypothetical protein